MGVVGNEYWHWTYKSNWTLCCDAFASSYQPPMWIAIWLWSNKGLLFNCTMNPLTTKRQKMKIILPLHCRCSHVRFLAAPNESVCELLQDSIARFNIIDEPEGGIKNRLKSFSSPHLWNISSRFIPLYFVFLFKLSYSNRVTWLKECKTYTTELLVISRKSKRLRQFMFMI